MRFKTEISPTATFSVGGATYQCIDGVFETEDAELIDALKKNVNFTLVPSKATPNPRGET